MNLEGSPILLEENWKFVFGRLLGVLNISMIYGWLVWHFYVVIVTKPLRPVHGIQGSKWPIQRPSFGSEKPRLFPPEICEELRN